MGPNAIENDAAGCCVAGDRRREPRYAAAALPVYRSADFAAQGTGAQPIGRVCDISRAGMRVASGALPRFERPVGLTLFRADGPGAPGASLQVIARLVWLGPAEDGDGFEWGCEFIAPAASTIGAIDALLGPGSGD